MAFSLPILAVPYGMISNESYKDKKQRIIAIEDGFIPNELLQQKMKSIYSYYSRYIAGIKLCGKRY
ncbi:hypothetical protein CRG86_007220 [Photobacterium leiognathi]|nr:hypothetical protein CRG86_007220 [Photobacterium leiognathi]